MMKDKTKLVMLLLVFGIVIMMNNVEAKTVEYDEPLTNEDFDWESEQCYSYDATHFICENGWIENYAGYKIVHMTQVHAWYYSENIALHNTAEHWLNVWNYAGVRLGWD